MDVALGHRSYSRLSEVISLNPCCNGCRTWAKIWSELFGDREVLILVVMDVALGLLKSSIGEDIIRCLNPCCNGCRTWAGVFTNT